MPETPRMLIEPANKLLPAGTQLPSNDVSEALARRLRSETEGPNRGTIASVFLASKPIIDPGGD